MAKDVKQEIINAITEEMEKSNRLPWDSGLLNGTFYAANWKTGKLYRGINQILLHFFGKSETAEYMTFVQAKDAKASVKKGAKGVPVIKYALWNYTKKRYALDSDDKLESNPSATTARPTSPDGRSNSKPTPTGYSRARAQPKKPLHISWKKWRSLQHKEGNTMGWTGDLWSNPRTKKELRDYFEERLHSSKHRNHIIDYSIKGNVFYAAIDTDGDGAEVWALVVYYGYKTSRSNGRTSTEFLYKMENETEGPCARTCPKRIIRKLTPTEREYAINWRRACLGLPPVNPDQMNLFG